MRIIGGVVATVATRFSAGDHCHDSSEQWHRHRIQRLASRRDALLGSAVTDHEHDPVCQRSQWERIGDRQQRRRVEEYDVIACPGIS